MEKRISSLSRAVALAMALALGSDRGFAGDGGADRGGWLVTPAEAAGPKATAQRLLPPLKDRSAHAGPKVIVASPSLASVLHPPLAIDVRFQTAPDAPVDLASVKVVYVKLVDLDITSRIRPYLTAKGIDVADAKLPAGEHVIELTVGDVNGAETEERLAFTVEEN